MDGCMYKCKLVIVFVVSQMYGWTDERIDGWMDSVSLRYSFCGKSDGKMDGWMHAWMDNVSVRYRKGVWMDGRISVSLRSFLL